MIRYHESGMGLDAVEDLYERGALLDAWRELTSLSGPERSSGRARRFEARLLHHLGAPRRSRRANVRHYRHAPDDPYARSGFAFERLEARGPLDALDWLRRNPIVTADGHADDGLVADAFEVDVTSLIALRDFTAARRVLDRWRERGVRPADRSMCEAQLLARADRLADAVALAREQARAHPGGRRLAMVAAGLLVSSGAPQDAIALLRRTVDAMQARGIAEMLYSVALAHDEHVLVDHALERLAALVPEAEPEVLARIAFMRVEAAYRRGDLQAALALADGGTAAAPPEGSRDRSAAIGDAFDEKLRSLAERLRAATPESRRIVLDVPFVRQEHLGCAPATLASLSRYFGIPADHVELADRMCFHGTPAHAERSWAESHGFVAREMRLTWDVAVALVRRGIPFHLSTFVPGSGHAQAVMGIDERRCSIILRDPSIPLPIEVDAAAFLEAYRHCGPRCLVLVPTARASELEGVELPDAELYDELYEVERALAVHDRPRAATACARLVERAAQHRVTRTARRALAAYDDDPFAVRAIAEEALAADADDRLARLDLVSAEQVIAPRARRLDVLEEAARAHAKGAPIFPELLAKELSTDAREHPRAKKLARRALALQPDSARAVQLLAATAWAEGDAAYAVDAFRFAACLEPTNDERVRAYAFAARRTGRYEEALALIRECFAQLGGRAAAPALLLADALSEIGDAKGAADALAAGLERRPDDGALLLAASRRAAMEGRREEARSLLESARTKVEEVSWARGAAVLAVVEGRSEDEQLAAWRRVADTAPLAMDAQGQIAILLRRTKGYRAAIEHLASCAARFPHHRPTVRAHLEALREAPPERRIEALRAFLATEPADAWGRRELALALASAHRHDEARAELAHAAALDARALDLHATRASLAEQRADLGEARAAYLAVLDIDADVPGAILRLVEIVPPAERYPLLQHLFERVEQRAVSGATFEALYAAAVAHVSPEWLGAALQRLRTARPEVAAAWLLSIRHAMATRPAGEAAALAAEALARFPLMPEVHLDAADAFSVAGDADRAIHHLERAVALGPYLTRAVARLANELEARGERARVDALLDDARRRAQFDTTIALEQVRIRARRGDLLGAVDELELLLDREPDLDAAWDMLSGVASSGGAERERALAASARVASAHGWSVAAQSTHAFLLVDAGKPAEALALLESAASRGLSGVELRDATATALAMCGRTAEALAVCTPRPDEVLPPNLGFRAAWIHAHAGDLRRAITVLQGVLATHGSFIAGWQRLVDWWLEIGEPSAAVDAATRLVAIAPMVASSQTILGRVLLRVGDRDGARAAFQRAIERDPGGVSAAAELFRLAADARDARTADAAMSVLARRVEPHERAAFDVEAALVHADTAGALARFAQACCDAKTTAPVLVGAWEALCRWHRALEAIRVVGEVVARPDATEGAGIVWMRAGIAQNGYVFVTRLRELVPGSPAGRGAAAEAFESMAQAPANEVKRAMKGLRPWLTADDETWSAPLNTLVTKRLYGAAVSWGKSWRSRPAAPIPRLYTLAVAFHAAGLRRNAIELARALVSRAADIDARSFRAWIAFDEAASGRTDRAEAELALAEGGPVHGVAPYVRVLARHLVAIRSASPGERFARYAERRRELERLLGEASAYPSLADTARRFRWRLARDLGSVRPLSLGTADPVPAIAILAGIGIPAAASIAANRPQALIVVAVVIVPLALVWLGAAALRAVRRWIWLTF